MKKRKILRKVLISICLVLAVLSASFYIYTADYYKACEWAQEEENSDSSVDVYMLDNNKMVFSPKADVKTGIIFYPGGKVEIKTWPFNENVCIFSSNTTTHPLNYKKGVLISTKRDGKTPGYGMRNIEAVVEKYDGDFQIKEDGGLVKIEAMV